jgi:hypothetical protein
MWKCEVLLIAFTGDEPSFLERSWKIRDHLSVVFRGTESSTPKYLDPAAVVEFGTFKILISFFK